MYCYTVESSALGTADRPMDTEAMLRSLGVSGSLNGFDYTVYMVDCMVKNNGYKRTVTKALYPETAKHFGVSPSSVERALRTVILSCWQRSDHTMLDTLAGSHLERMPTNTVFLDILASHIR